jgi:amino acid transporter
MSATRDPEVRASSHGEKAALLHRGLGVSQIVFMVVAAVAPLGAAAAVIPLVFALGGNSSAPLYFVGAAVVLTVFAVGFTLMSHHVNNAGAFYSYVQAGLGKVAGAGTASLALVSYVILLIGLYALLGVFASAAADQYLGLNVKWWICTFAFLVLIALLGYRDIEVSAKVLGAALVLEAVAVLVVDFAVLLKGGDSGLSAEPLNLSNAFDGAPGLGLMFAFFGFVGFEATAVFRSEAKDPAPPTSLSPSSAVCTHSRPMPWRRASGPATRPNPPVRIRPTCFRASRIDMRAASSRTQSSSSW